jgi:hypothetical protein
MLSDGRGHDAIKAQLGFQANAIKCLNLAVSHLPVTLPLVFTRNKAKNKSDHFGRFYSAIIFKF